MMQFNSYHHYTVDEHLIRSVEALSEIDNGQAADIHPLSNKLIPGIADRTVLYVAVLLHDVAKGRQEDHSIAGARIARKLCPPLGMNENHTALMAFILEHPLLIARQPPPHALPH